MKILITTDLFTTATNGVVTSVRNLQDELQKDGHDVRILTLSGNGRSYRKGNVSYIRSVSLEAVYPNVRMPTSYRHRLIRELIAWKPDVIHSQCEFFTFQYALRISKRTGAPIVHTYHTLYEQYFPYLIPSIRLGNQVVGVMSKKRLKRVKRVIAPTHKVERQLHSYGLTNPISVVPSGIDLAQHSELLSTDCRSARRRALGITDDQIVMLNLGRLGIEKNIDELLQLFARAVSYHTNLVFLIVGDGPARMQLTALSEELGIQRHVFFTGMVEPREVQNYYQLGDVFVSASTSETQGLTYIEAAANGLPLLCRQDPCLEDVLVPGQNGCTYTTDEEFLAAVDRICSDPEWRKYAGLKSQEIASRYDKTVFGDSVEALYNSILN